MADTIDKARSAAIRSLARDLRVVPSEAERWFVAWEQFASRYGGARNVHFWDAGRGWIDAQLSFQRQQRELTRRRAV
jgi:hypothetical protein